MVDVVSCRSLDTEHLLQSLDSQVGHDETRLWDSTQTNIVRLINRSSVVYRRFFHVKEEDVNLRWCIFCFFLIVHGLFMIVATRLAYFC